MNYKNYKCLVWQISGGDDRLVDPHINNQLSWKCSILFPGPENTAQMNNF